MERKMRNKTHDSNVILYRNLTSDQKLNHHCKHTKSFLCGIIREGIVCWRGAALKFEILFSSFIGGVRVKTIELRL